MRIMALRWRLGPCDDECRPALFFLQHHALAFFKRDENRYLLCIFPPHHSLMHALEYLSWDLLRVGAVSCSFILEAKGCTFSPLSCVRAVGHVWHSTCILVL